jgi:hypothetical protein
VQKTRLQSLSFSFVANFTEVAAADVSAKEGAAIALLHWEHGILREDPPLSVPDIRVFLY